MIKKIEINKQINMRDINNAPPSKNLLNNVDPIIPVVIAIILNVLVFIFIYMLS